MQPAPILTEAEFAQFQNFIYRHAGISLSPAKKTLVSGRLYRRLGQHGLRSFGEYLSLLRREGNGGESQIAIDLLTTHETWFFREPRHFDFLAGHVASRQANDECFRVWSAACSSGEEAYSIVMMLADCLGPDAWEVVASDISQGALDSALAGHYPMSRAGHIPEDYLRRFCLKGIDGQTGTFLVCPELRERVKFARLSLTEPLPALGEFDVVFLRNVMIYFGRETKRQVAERLLTRIKPGGYLFVGHAEGLHGLTERLRPAAPSIYQAP